MSYSQLQNLYAAQAVAAMQQQAYQSPHQAIQARQEYEHAQIMAEHERQKEQRLLLLIED